MNNHNKLRHQAEITADCRIMLESISNRPYAFSVLPSRTDRLYILDGVTQEDRVFFFFNSNSIGHVDSLYSGLQVLSSTRA